MEVIDSRAFSKFCEVDSPKQIPDGDMVGRFRGILTEKGIQKRLFSQVVKILEQEELILNKGTIVDSTIIKAPTSTKNKEKNRDSEIHSTKKGSTWYFGYKAHIGVDSKTILVHTVKATSANVHDVTKVLELLTGKEKFVYDDSGYLGAEKREHAFIKNNNRKKSINRRPSQIKKLSKSGQYKAKN